MNASAPLFVSLDLHCDLLFQPELARIATRTPIFGWAIQANGSFFAQKSYHVLVSSTEKLALQGEGDLWDSGCVASAQSLGIAYAGKPLAWGQTCYWTVQITDATGAVSGWAKPQRFTLADAEPIEPTSVYPQEVVTISPKSVHSFSDGSWLIDFGRDAFGWLELTVDNPPPGRVMTLRVGEALKDGRVDMEPGGSIRAEEFSLTLEKDRTHYRIEMKPGALNLRPEAIKIPAEFGIVMPFRYVEITGLPETAPSVVQKRLQYHFDEQVAAFRSSSTDLNTVWSFCRYSMLATSFAGYYVDGDRERIPYEADVTINQLSHYAVDREFSLARRSHEYLLHTPTWPTEWKQHSVIIAWQDYEATGDARSLARNYSILRDEKMHLNCARPDGLLDTHELRDIVDWPLPERDNYEFVPVNTVVNAFHYRTLILMARIARALGKDTDAADWEARAAIVYRVFNERLFDITQGLYTDGEGSLHASLHANLFALAFGLVPEERKEVVVMYLKSRGMACSVYPAQFLLEALFEAREADYAIGLMTSHDLRSWLNMLAKGATITMEAWDQTFKPNQDWNHAWGAAPANIIARYVLGVRPLEPGYGRIVIDPQLGPLDEVEGVVPTIRGPVWVHAWKECGSRKIQKEYRIPRNMTVV